MKLLLYNDETTMERQTMTDTETQERFIELRASGYSFDKIALELGVCKTTLLKLSRKLAGEIERLKFINFEALAEKHKMLKASRLEALGKLLERVDSAIGEADLSKLSPDRLVLLRLRLAESIKEELADSFKVERGHLTSFFENDKDQDYVLKVD